MNLTGNRGRSFNPEARVSARAVEESFQMQLKYSGKPSSEPIFIGFWQRVKRKSRGRWHLILQKLGVPASVLTGQRVRCPECGGELQFLDADRRGSFMCHGSGRPDSAGNGFVLVMHLGLLDFGKAVRVVGEAISEPYSRGASHKRRRRTH